MTEQRRSKGLIKVRYRSTGTSLAFQGCQSWVRRMRRVRPMRKRPRTSHRIRDRRGWWGGTRRYQIGLSRVWVRNGRLIQSKGLPTSWLQGSRHGVTKAQLMNHNRQPLYRAVRKECPRKHRSRWNRASRCRLQSHSSLVRISKIEARNSERSKPSGRKTWKSSSYRGNCHLVLSSQISPRHARVTQRYMINSNWQTRLKIREKARQMPSTRDRRSGKTSSLKVSDKHIHNC